MAKGATARRIDEVPTDQKWLPGFSGGPPSPPPAAPTAPAVSNARLGLLVFLGAEAMFFVGLIGAFLVFRLGSEVWPPPAQPRLPVGVTGINTVILLFSGLTGYLALRAVRDGNSRGLFQWILTTVGLGTLFLSIQGYEWIRLIHFGLTVSSGTYGTTFYTLIGFHGLHVFVAVIWLMIVLLQARRGRFTSQSHAGVETCSMYWTFVVGLWPLLYGLVYLF